MLFYSAKRLISIIFYKKRSLPKSKHYMIEFKTKCENVGYIYIYILIYTKYF